MTLFRVLLILATSHLFASEGNWKKHRTCFEQSTETRGHCQKINLNNDARITKKNKIQILESQLCQVAQFSYDFHFKFSKKSVTIRDVDIRKFLHRDFKQTNNSDALSCLRKLNMHLGEFNRKAKVFFPCSESQNDFTEVHLINNCREPGNYEFNFFNNGRLSFKAHTLFNRNFYERILLEYTSSYGEALDINKSHIGYTKAMFFQTSQERTKNNFYLFNPAPNFNQLQKENSCKIKQLEELSSNSRVIGRGKLNTYKEKILYSQFDKETKKKSGYVKSQEPLSYIRTPCKKDHNYSEQVKLLPPKGLHKHSSYGNDQDAWSKSDCQYIPYTFETYDQLTTYNSAFSAFEVDGLYTGHSSNGGRKSNRNGARWDASLFHLKNLSSYEISKTKGSLRNIKLINTNEGTSLIIGNLDLKRIKTKDISFLMGIDAQKLVSKYNSVIFKNKSPLFSFAYDSRNGEILNQHDLNKVGFEKIWIRQRGKSLIIDLISHERITPVWRGVIKYIE